MDYSRVGGGQLPPSSPGVIVSSPPKQENYCSRAMAAIADILICIWNAIKEFFSCSPAPKHKDVIRFKQPLMTEMGKICSGNRADMSQALDNFLLFLSTFKIINMEFTRCTSRRDGAGYYIIVITSPDAPAISEALKNHAGVQKHRISITLKTPPTGQPTVGVDIHNGILFLAFGQN